MKKRLLAVLLALVLCTGVLLESGVALAAEQADLIVTDLYWNTPTQVKPGTEIVFSVKVKNAGSEAVNQPIVVNFGAAKDVFATVTYSDGIPAGGEVVIKSQPWTAVVGDHMLAVRVNATETVSESNTKNNTMQTALRVAEDVLEATFMPVQERLSRYGIDSLIFSDDFDTLDTIDNENSGAEGYKWYVKRPYGASTLTTNDYSVQDGVISLHAEKPTYNYGLGTFHHETEAGFVHNTGYLEIRLRIPSYDDEGTGGPAIWALPTTKLTNRAPAWVELDWMEYWGIVSWAQDGYYTISVHEVHYPNFDRVRTAGYKNSNYIQHGLGDGQWHIMGWLWREGEFITYLDGVPVMTLTYGEGKDPSPKHTVVNGEEKLGVFSMLDEQLMPIIIGGSKDNPMELDYVRLWNANEHYTADDAASEAFVKTYAKDAEGKAIVTPDATNYAAILSGEAQWAALSDGVKELVNARLADYGQPAFTELLTKAKAVEAALNATEPPTDPPADPGGSQKKPGNAVILYASIGAGVILLLVIVGILVKKKRK